MKLATTLPKLSSLFLLGFIFISTFSIAQRRGGSNVNVNINIGSRPEPVRMIRYYYYPDHNVYYDCDAHEYIGYHRGRWIRNVSINFDVDDVFFVNIDFRGRDPYCENDFHRRQYCHREVVYVERDRCHGKGHHKKHKKHRHHDCDDWDD